MNKKILFIEDERALQDSLSEALKKEGFVVLSALDGKTGLEIAEKEKPDLILLDLILPRMDGFVVLEKLKEKKETKDIPVIVLTNLEEIKSVERVMVLGAKGYLVKSYYSLEDLVDKIKKEIK
jgi:two-component system alkaline phosphatase synthesis response regulator PhoP